MKVAYVDTSCLVAIAFDEPAGRQLAPKLRKFGRLVASNLLEAELRAALAREVREASATDLLGAITWVLPNRPLTAELGRVLSVGVVKGADLWHLACALFLDPGPRELSFLTLDKTQARMASRLGFPSR